LKAEEQAAMELAIVSDPEAHPVMVGMGGIRKARWARHGGGKSGGVRTIYYVLNVSVQGELQMVEGGFIGPIGTITTKLGLDF